MDIKEKVRLIADGEFEVCAKLSVDEITQICRDFRGAKCALDIAEQKLAAMEPDDWKTKAAAWLREKAMAQHQINIANPEHTKAYPYWEQKVRELNWLQAELLIPAPSHSQQSAHALLRKASEALEAVCEFPDSQESAWEARRNAEDLVVEIVNHLRDRTPSQLNAPRVLNEDTLYILGRPNFWCRTIADRMRCLGHEIPNKSEDEQAHVINLMLDHYERFGDDWRSKLESYLRSNASCPSHESEQGDGL